MNNRLFIIEGLPCSGKSTTAEFTANLLREKYNVFSIDEGSCCHPADYEFHAFVSKHSMSDFNETERNLLIDCGEKTNGGYIVPLSDFEGVLFDRLIKYKIYDFLPLKIEMPLMLEKWQNFVKNADKETIYVFNCVFLQNPMCETMMRFCFSEEQSLNYISQIAEITRPMNPVVIYLRNDDIADSVRKTAAERDGWLESVIDYHVKGAYGKSITASGFDGYIQCLTERQRRELNILSVLPVSSLVLDNPHRNWKSAYDEIIKYINALKNPMA
ncbi:MAG: hypothetical protein IJ416_09775 [Ruminiclostridium sp.]|nr:hypothetical protein [Ruminiclostridium sp.]